MYIRIFARVYSNVQEDSQIIEDVQICMTVMRIIENVQICANMIMYIDY